MTHPIDRAITHVVAAKEIAVMSGAGISVESGIPPFRGKGGIWEKFDPMEYAHIDAFLKQPEKVWRVLLSEMANIMAGSHPNTAHEGLARLEKMGKLKTVITQNVDGLHQRAGNTDVIEFHGNFASYSCMKCAAKIDCDTLPLDELPPRCSCGGVYRPDCVFFGEMIPEEAMERAEHAAQTCDVMLVVGTSGMVYPAAQIPLIAKRAGAFIIEINPERTPLSGAVSDLFLMGKAGETLKHLVDRVEERLQGRSP